MEYDWVLELVEQVLLIRSLVVVLFVWSLRKYVESFLGIKLLESK